MNLLQSYITQHVPELGRDKPLTQTRQYYDYILDEYPDDVVGIFLPKNPTNTLNFSTNALQRFTRLEKFNCHNSNFTSLPNLPNTLKILQCVNNRLISLPPLPNGLKELWCSANNLTSLPPLPNGLLALWCYDNRLTSLPLLPITLNNLICDNNLFPQSYGEIDAQYLSESKIQRFNIKIHPELAPQTEQIMQQAQEIQLRREPEEERRQQNRGEENEQHRQDYEKYFRLMQQLYQQHPEQTNQEALDILLNMIQELQQNPNPTLEDNQRIELLLHLYNLLVYLDPTEEDPEFRRARQISIPGLELEEWERIPEEAERAQEQWERIQEEWNQAFQQYQEEQQIEQQIEQAPQFRTNVTNVTDCKNNSDDDIISRDPINQEAVNQGMLVKLSNGKCYYYETMREWIIRKQNRNELPIFPESELQLTPDDLALLGLRQAGGRRRKRKTRRRSARRRKRRTRARAKV